MYYYLTASLPALTLGDPPPFSSEDFLFHCQGALSEADWNELRCVVENRLDEAQASFTRQWYDLDTQMRNTVARIRANRIGVDVRPYLRPHGGYSMAAEHEVSDAMSRSHLLERVTALDRSRWNALDDLVGENQFGFPAVLAFAVKLRLMERWARLSEDVGRERIETFITDNVDKAMQQQLGEA
jgi:hypothetical protein